LDDPRPLARPEGLKRHEDTLLLVITLLVGAVVGLVVVAFIVVTERLGSQLYPAEAAAWRRLAVPVLGALVSGWLLVRYFPEARGSGIPQTKTALFLRQGRIRLRTVIGKFACSSIALSSGIALGREGPTVHVGAGVASVLGRRLGLGPRQIQALIPVGTSAAVAAAFNTPIAGVLFTLEEILGDLHARVIGSVVISAATSWAVLNLLLGDEPLFHVPAYQLVHPIELPLYAVLGLSGGLVSVAFVKLLLFLRKHFLRLPRWTLALQPAAGGLVVGIFGWFVPEVLGVGYTHVGDALNGRMVFGSMALLLALKVVATATCYASGNAGGIFGPSLFIGAMLGGGIGSVAHAWLPEVTGSAGAYALVGMGAAFAGIVRAPMTSVIMIFEITRDYSIIVPVMIANLLSYFIAQRLQPKPVYEALLDQDGIQLPATRAPAAGPVVRHVMRPVRAAGTPDGATGPLLQPAESDAVQQCYVYPDEPAETAIRRMGECGVSELPVVSREDRSHQVGRVSLADLPSAYRRYQQGESGRAARAEAASPRKLLTAVIAGVIGLFLLGSLLAHQYYSARIERAAAAFMQGTELTRENRHAEAVERYRAALSLARSNEYRLALGLALARAGRPAEARVYLEQVLEREPQNGRALLALARLEAGEDNIDTALAAYRQAIDGIWQQGAQGQVEAFFELADLLQRANEERQAVAELLRLVGRRNDPATQVRVGRALLSLGSAYEARAVFRDVLTTYPGQVAAHVGLGQAEWALGNLRAAGTALREAARLNPADETIRQEAEVVDRVLSLDPLLRGLSAAQRRQRSLRLLDAALLALEACSPRPYTPETAGLIGRAESTVRTPARARPTAVVVEENLELAEALWERSARECPDTPADPALGRIFAARDR
jgi:chloride channel protein, CIC family